MLTQRNVIKMAYVHGTGPPRHSRDSIPNIVTTVTTNNTMHDTLWKAPTHVLPQLDHDPQLSEARMTPETIRYSTPVWYHCHYLNRNNCRM